MCMHITCVYIYMGVCRMPCVHSRRWFKMQNPIKNNSFLRCHINGYRFETKKTSTTYRFFVIVFGWSFIFGYRFCWQCVFCYASPQTVLIHFLLSLRLFCAWLWHVPLWTNKLSFGYRFGYRSGFVVEIENLQSEKEHNMTKSTPLTNHLQRAIQTQGYTWWVCSTPWNQSE